MIRSILISTAGPLAVILVAALPASGGVFTDSFTDPMGLHWNTVYAQGFTAAVAPVPDPGLSFSDMVSLEQFQFFKSGNADTIGTAGGPASVQMAIISNIYSNITNLTVGMAPVVGISTNSISSTAGLATGAPITFKFDNLHLIYGANYGAVIVSNNGGMLTPQKISALDATYVETSPGSGMYVPRQNYGIGDGTTDYNDSTSNFITVNADGSSYFFGYSVGGDAAFTATMNHIVHGDFNGDGLVNAADIGSMMTALADVPKFQTTNFVSNSDLVTMGDFDGDLTLTNLDLQGLIVYLANGGAGGGTIAAVPEPASAAMLAAGGLILLGLRKREAR
jgi:hypothetical protein